MRCANVSSESSLSSFILSIPAGTNMNRLLRRLLLWTCLGLLSVPGIARERKAWNSQAAAAYLDARAGWWRTWPRAARDHDTFCISCHTALPYALARPVLRFAAGEKAPSGIEQ